MDLNSKSSLKSVTITGHSHLKAYNLLLENSSEKKTQKVGNVHSQLKATLNIYSTHHHHHL
jgi:hypothetical protein